MFDNVAIYALTPAEQTVADSDGDGVDDVVDDCPSVNSAPFDSDGNGCVDDGAGGRHVEYWARPAFPITYVINKLGAPLVSDGSDFTAIQNGMAAWSGLTGSEASATYGGTTYLADARAMDQVNLITFEDPEYPFGLGVLAVGLTTSFTDTTTFNGIKYRPGQIVDTDMIFNKAKGYRTLSDGPAYGTLIETVATHEAGHLYGIAHSAIRSSTMFYVLSPDTSAMTLATEDKLALFKAYGTPAAMGAASRLTGTVKDGLTNAPVPGAAVFAINAASGDTSGCEYTLPSDGSYTFVGLPDGDYYVAIHPLNGSSTIGYLVPEYINELIADHAVREFVAESWDAAESKNDDPSARSPVTVLAASQGAVANFLTNVDETGPVVVSTAPEASASGVSIGGSVLVGFSEPIESATLSGNFRLEDVPTGTFVAGNAALLRDDSVLAFVPSDGLYFETEYRLTLETGLQDKYGNGLAAPFVMTFTTEIQPDVAITSLSPSKGIVGSIVSVNGFGFDESPANNLVSFNGTPAPVMEGSATQLVVTVPEGATSGYVTVFNQTQGLTSN
ncbi:Ig-like domain-containing protein, partial [Candidatus Uhrbacteria bacterium]|nr:Ig-like domain-containing protein [Candidatus Uhrbacteria bacterium]